MNKTDLSPILIIAYKFPPYPGIGGRRWAKFAKCLAKLGHPVHVICAKNPQVSESLWLEDTQHENISIHSYSSHYPSYLNQFSGGFVHKLKSKFMLWKLNTFSKGTPYDMAILDQKIIEQIASTLIKKHNIKHVVATGAPFRSLYYTALLKKKFNFHFIADFRDPWTWSKNYGFGSLSKDKEEFEKMMEKTVVEEADTVFVPVHPMQNELQKNYSNCKEKIKILPHAFDLEEIGNQTRTEVSSKIRLIHIGTIYYTSKEVIEDLAASLTLRKNEIELHFYSSESTFKEIFERHGLLGTTVQYFNLVSPKELFKLISTYNYFLLIHAAAGANNISTKFYEVIATKTPILFIAPEGIAGKFVRDNSVGVHWLPQDVLERTKELKKDVFSFSLQFNLSDYTFMEITKNILLTSLNLNEHENEDLTSNFDTTDNIPK